MLALVSMARSQSRNSIEDNEMGGFYADNLSETAHAQKFAQNRQCQ